MPVARASDDAVTLYLRRIGTVPLLTAAEEVELAKVIEDGKAQDATRARQIAGEAARERFIEANLRLVVSVAKRHLSTGVPLLDLVQMGNVGLMRAVELFDWRRGWRFSTYGTGWIRQAIGKGAPDATSPIHLPGGFAFIVSRVGKAVAELEGRLGRPPTVDEIVVESGYSPEEVVKALQAPRVVSTSMPLGEDLELEDILADEGAEKDLDGAVKRADRVGFDAALACLSPREQRVLRLRFGIDDGIPCTLDEVAKDIGFTKQAAGQTEARAMSKLRHPVFSPVTTRLSP